MLKKLYRVAKQRDFEKIKKRGKSFFLPNIAMRCLGTSQSYTRFGFIVSNKISKKATERNRIRRQLSEAVGRRIGQVTTGVDCVIMVRPGIKKERFQDIEQKIDKLFRKARIIKDYGKTA